MGYCDWVDLVILGEGLVVLASGALA